MSYTYTPGMRLYAETAFSRVGSIATVERVTPTGRAVLPNGMHVTPDGYAMGTRGDVGRARYRPATEEDERTVADSHARQALASRWSRYGYNYPPLTAEECTQIWALLDAADARRVRR